MVNTQYRLNINDLCHLNTIKPIYKDHPCKHQKVVSKRGLSHRFECILRITKK